LEQISVDLNACKTEVEKKKVIHACSKIKTLSDFSVRENTTSFKNYTVTACHNCVSNASCT
jgi:hypothetical protein